MAGTVDYLDAASPFTKDVWLQGAWEQFEDTPGNFFNMLDQIEPTRMEGRNCYFKTDIGDSLGQGMVTAGGGDFPAAQDSEWDEGKLTMARLAHTASLSMDEWETLRSDAAAAVDVVAHKIGKATTKMTRELSRQVHSDGTAILARCGVTSASTTVVIQGTTTNQYDRDRLNWLAARRVIIDIVDTANGAASATRRLITSVADDGLSIVISGAAVTTDTADVITWAGSVDDFSSGSYVSGEVVGIGQLMKTDRTWLGINSATAGKEFWDPTVVYGASAGTPEAVTITRLQKLYIRMAQKISDGMMPGPETGHVLWSNLGVAANAIATLVGQIQFLDPRQTDGPMDFGFREISGLGIRWFTDVHYSHNVLDCLKVEGENGLSFVRPTNPMQGLLDFVTTGSGDMWHLHNATSGNGHAAGMNAYLTGLFGVACKKPAEHGRLQDCSETS